MTNRRFFAATAFAVSITFVSAADKPNTSPAKQNGSIPLSKGWTMERVLAVGHEDTIALWKTLPPAPLSVMRGHYVGLVPNAGDPARQAGMADYMYNETSVRGYWLGKVFRQTSVNAGEGYNMWRFPAGKIVRNLRFATRKGPSLINGKPSLLIDGAYSSSTLVDEIRKVEEGVSVGLATTRAKDGTRNPPDHFFLIGPFGEWTELASGK